MNGIIVKLECITNMHAGNGDVNYNIIDNEVEKDPVTGYPTINASGVKGALREYFRKNEELSQYVENLFGENRPGRVKILGANMLALAVRASKGSAPYYLVTTEEALNEYKENCNLFLGKKIDIKSTEVKEECAVDGKRLEKKVVIPDVEAELYVLEETDFEKIPLPVVARNKLNDGKSVNLWYEEIVPHKSIFYFAVLPEDDKAREDFEKGVKDGEVIQFGGNASIGYGLCKVSIVGGKADE